LMPAQAPPRPARRQKSGSGRRATVLDTPQRYPRAGSQSFPTSAADTSTEGSTTVYFSPTV
jgi:hypothetical protein